MVCRLCPHYVHLLQNHHCSAVSSIEEGIMPPSPMPRKKCSFFLPPGRHQGPSGAPLASCSGGGGHNALHYTTYSYCILGACRSGGVFHYFRFKRGIYLFLRNQMLWPWLPSWILVRAPGPKYFAWLRQNR